MFLCKIVAGTFEENMLPFRVLPCSWSSVIVRVVGLEVGVKVGDKSVTTAIVMSSIGIPVVADKDVNRLLEYSVVSTLVI